MSSVRSSLERTSSVRSSSFRRDGSYKPKKLMGPTTIMAFSLRSRYDVYFFFFCCLIRFVVSYSHPFVYLIIRLRMTS
jgi:hypothetical protein